MSRTGISSGRLSVGPVNSLDVTSPTTRLGVVTVLGFLTLLTPWLGIGLSVGYLLIGVVIILRPFERLNQPLGLSLDDDVGWFAIAVAIVTVFSTMENGSLTHEILVVGIGITLGGLYATQILTRRTQSLLGLWSVFIVGGTIVGMLFHELSGFLDPGIFGFSLEVLLFLVIAGSMIGTLPFYRCQRLPVSSIYVTVAFTVALFGGLGIDMGRQWILLAAGSMGVFGLLAYRTGIASIQGMAAGVFLGFMTLAYGGLSWFVLLFTFVAGGALVTKYQYDHKASIGVAEDDLGTRGLGNVFGNGAMALVGVIGYRGAVEFLPLLSDLFVLIFVAAMATALADTLSSEIGVLFDTPRLITTLKPVPVGTNGGVTWQGALVGAVGSLTIALLSFLLFPTFGPVYIGIVCIAGVAGMMADSLFGATIEGKRIGNQGVNLLATITGALVGLVLAIGLGALW